MKNFRIVERKKDCVLLIKHTSGEKNGMYQIRDIENDIIYMGYDYDVAKEIFDNYDIERIRAKRAKTLDEWIKENVE